MKKWLMPLIAFLILIVVVGGIFLLIRLLLPSSSDSNLSADEVEAYAAQHWPQYTAQFDKKSQTLQLFKETKLSYDQACKIGGSVYSDSTAPESYLDAAYSIRTDLLAQFPGSSPNVKLVFLSTDNKTVFSVSTEGTIETCWE